MSQLLELPLVENSLIAAYEAIVSRDLLATDNDIATIYEQYFVTAVPSLAEKSPSFERVSLVDPSIRTVLRSSTAVI
jgi:hypothetical protein